MLRNGRLELYWVVTLAVLVLFLPAALFGQGTSRGTLVGTVTDSTGAVVPDVKITITNIDTGIEQSLTTGDVGVYTVPNLSVGNYTVTAELSGFKQAVVENIRLEVGATYRADIALEVGDLASQVTVEASTPLLRTDDAEVSHVIEQKRIVDLPLNGRDFQQLQLLTPGSVNSFNFQTSRGLSAGASALTTTLTLNVSNGSRPGSQLFLVDGGDATNQHARTIIVPPNVDEIEEFRFSGANFSAEYGYGTNVVNVSTKAGTNDLHGAAWYFNRDDSLAARSFFQSSVGDLTRNQFGVAIGGPIVKNKAFFFFTYEGQREDAARTSLATVPTAKMRGGDLSELPVQIFDPATSRVNEQGVAERDPFPGNIIPASRLDPISQLFLEWVPLPNGSGITNNFNNNPTAENEYNQYTGKVDYSVTNKDFVMGRYTYRPASFPFSIGPYQGNSRGDYSPGTIIKETSSITSVASWIHSYSPTTQLEMRGSYSSAFVDFVNLNIRPGGTDWTQESGIQGFGPGVSDVFPSLPTFNITGFRGIPTGTAFNVREHNFNFSANLSMVRGAHSIKIGHAWRSYQENIHPFGAGSGTFGYTGQYTSNPAQAGATGSGLGDYLLGIPFSAGRYVPPGKSFFRFRNSWTYIQDDWKVSPNVTINFGMRYEINFPTVEKYNQIATFQANGRGGRGAIVVPSEESISEQFWPLHPSLRLSLPVYRPLIITAAEAGIPDKSLRFNSFNNFAPRMGLAYRLGSDMTIRFGYGIYVTQVDGNRETEYLSPPFLIRESGLLNDVDANGSPIRTTGNFLPSDSKFSPQPSLLAHDPLFNSGWNSPYGYTQQWNLAVQRLLPGHFTAEVAYVGSKSDHQQGRINVNSPLPGPGLGRSIQERRPFPDFRTIAWNDQDTSSIYHSFQSKIERRFRDGLTVLGAFTWSKAIDDASESGEAAFNPRDRRGSMRGPSTFDVPLVFAFSAIYELPFFSSSSTSASSPFLHRLVGGWSIGTIVNFQSGFPYTPGWAGDVSNTGRGARPTRMCDGRLDDATIERWFDTSCFTAPAPFTFGNAGRNILRGDTIQSVDLAVYKTFAITERHRAQFRAEFFNLPNHPDFGLPRSTINTPSAGQVSRASPGRIVQFGVKYYF
jgi:hypothetical protein